MPLFEVAIIEKPTKKDAEEGKGERLIMAPEAVIARDAQTAALAATRGQDFGDLDFNRVEVLVRPFV